MSEVVIIRRKPSDDGGAVKGGAWKIAYADFVTAMMAFFLVMWLINASNEATRAQVASYFNPIKLTDNSTGNRGLTDPKDAPKKTSTGAAEAASQAKKEGDLAAAEDELMRNPAVALDRIAGAVEGNGNSDAGARDASHVSEDGLAPGIGDPFDPRSWETVPETAAPPPVKASETAPGPDRKQIEENPEEKPALQPQAEQANEAKKPGVKTESRPASPKEDARVPIELAPGPDGKHTEENPEEKPALQPQAKQANEAKKPGVKTESRPATPKEDARVPIEPANPEAPPVPATQAPPGQNSPKPDIAAIERRILEALRNSGSELRTGFSIRLVPEGALISLTDKNAIGMFQSGSSEPGTETVALIAAIAGALKDQPGYVVVRGHTDSIPYRGPKYDNWQLSTARAHMTQYMLVRGGLDEKRIRRVEGVADREPLIPSNPEAPENRRIEILLGIEP